MDVTDQVKHKIACIQDTIAAIAEIQQQLKVNSLQVSPDIPEFTKYLMVFEITKFGVLSAYPTTAYFQWGL